MQCFRGIEGSSWLSSLAVVFPCSLPLKQRVVQSRLIKELFGRRGVGGDQELGVIKLILSCIESGINLSHQVCTRAVFLDVAPRLASSSGLADSSSSNFGNAQ